jgi:transcriptional regulator with XRE-family HTH domain
VVEVVDVHIGKRLRWRRRAMGLTQGDLASVIGVRFQQIQKYDCAANRTSAAVLWKLACALDVNVHYFYEGLASLSPPTSLTANPAANPAPARQREAESLSV